MDDFEDIQIDLGAEKKRVIRQKNRPDKDPNFATVKISGSGGAGTFIALSALEQALDWGQSDSSREMGGLLLGEPFTDGNETLIDIRAFIKAPSAKGTSTELTFGQEAWEEMNSQKEAKYPDLQIVGWFHTHPGLGVFLSEKDLFICRHFFSQPHQVAMVADTETGNIGLFGWAQQDIKRRQAISFYAPAALKKHVQSRALELKKSFTVDDEGVVLLSQVLPDFLLKLLASRLGPNPVISKSRLRIIVLAVLAAIVGIALIAAAISFRGIWLKAMGLLDTLLDLIKEMLGLVPI